MEELISTTAKYQPEYIERSFSSMAGMHEFSVTFYRDVSDLYAALTRLKHVDRNPTGFSVDDAPILGLLVRISKLAKELVHYYETDNAEMICVLDRLLVEASVIATYLMMNGLDAVSDYRKCSYKDRLRILREMESGSPFFDTKAGERLVAAVREKMDLEGLSKDDFAEQKKNRWKLQGKSFRTIFAEVEHDDLYSATYGIMSESITGHGMNRWIGASPGMTTARSLPSRVLTPPTFVLWRRS